SDLSFIWRPPHSPTFPYTTLFRSARKRKVPAYARRRAARRIPSRRERHPSRPTGHPSIPERGRKEEEPRHHAHEHEDAQMQRGHEPEVEGDERAHGQYARPRRLERREGQERAGRLEDERRGRADLQEDERRLAQQLPEVRGECSQIEGVVDGREVAPPRVARLVEDGQEVDGAYL